jgi:hypothetical protein
MKAINSSTISWQVSIDISQVSVELLSTRWNLKELNVFAVIFYALQFC